MQQRKYPIGLNRFREIREEGYVYIDKTEIIYRLVETGKYYFLNRPRLFGKRLLLDTIAELFEGSKELFKGLWIYDKWDWSLRSPVIRINYANMDIGANGLKAAIYRVLEDNAKRLGVTLSEPSYDLQFRELIEKVYIKTKQRVVILISDNDKPVVDYLDDLELVKANSAIMQNFYSILKGSDGCIHLLLITGESFVSGDSELNHLQFITLSSRFGAICGITQPELEENFSAEIAELEKERPDILAQIKDWYYGYTWNRKDIVYNPFSVLRFMADPVFRSYWYPLAVPGFVRKFLEGLSLEEMEDFSLGGNALSLLYAERPYICSLFFQMGFLTVKEISDCGQVYALGIPNMEVKECFLKGGSAEVV